MRDKTWSFWIWLSKIEDFVEKGKKTSVHGLKIVASNALKIKIDSKNFEWTNKGVEK